MKTHAYVLMAEWISFNTVTQLQNYSFINIQLFIKHSKYLKWISGSEIRIKEVNLWTIQHKTVHRQTALMLWIWFINTNICFNFHSICFCLKNSSRKPRIVFMSSAIHCLCVWATLKCYKQSTCRFISSRSDEC